MPTMREFLAQHNFDSRETSSEGREYSGLWSPEAEAALKNCAFFQTFIANCAGHKDYGKRCISATVFKGELDLPLESFA